MEGREKEENASCIENQRSRSRKKKINIKEMCVGDIQQLLLMKILKR